MRQIKKKPEPSALTEFRFEPNTSWESISTEAKQRIREALVREQGWICCYCMRRIKPAASEMGIEHWAPRSRHPQRQLEWTNLLGVCLGDPKAPVRAQHCDRTKRDTEIELDPKSAAHVSTLSLLGLHSLPDLAEYFSMFSLAISDQASAIRI